MMLARGYTPMSATHYTRHDAGRLVEVFVGSIEEVCMLVNIFKGAHPRAEVRFEQYDRRVGRATIEVEDVYVDTNR